MLSHGKRKKGSAAKGLPEAPRRPAIVQYWHSASVPGDIRGLMATFRDRNPGMHHLLFDEHKAKRFIAEHFTQREVAAFQTCAVPAMQADYFRYCAILSLGGIYADARLVCKTSLRPLLDEIDGGLLVRLPPGRVIYNGFFAFPAPGHPFLRLALDIATTNIEHRMVNTVNFVTGPLIFTCMVELHRAGSLEAARGWSPEPPVNRLTELIYATINDQERLDVAFDGIRIEAARRNEKWVTTSGSPRQRRQAETHWSRWPATKGSIFRCAS